MPWMTCVKFFAFAKFKNKKTSSARSLFFCIIIFRVCFLFEQFSEFLLMLVIITLPAETFFLSIFIALVVGRLFCCCCIFLHVLHLNRRLFRVDSGTVSLSSVEWRKLNSYKNKNNKPTINHIWQKKTVDSLTFRNVESFLSLKST